jgi:hypothetical protein
MTRPNLTSLLAAFVASLLIECDLEEAKQNLSKP